MKLASSSIVNHSLTSGIFKENSTIETKIMLINTARWPEPNAGWCVGMCGEAYLALDFFGSFCIKAKRTITKSANTAV